MLFRSSGSVCKCVFFRLANQQLNPVLCPLLPQLHNEDDLSEASTSAQPSTSAQASATPEPALQGGDAEAPPPPYTSIALGAAAGTLSAPHFTSPHLTILTNQLSPLVAFLQRAVSRETSRCRLPTVLPPLCPHTMRQRRPRQHPWLPRLWK